MKEDLIVPCGMNCSLCNAYQFMKKRLKQVWVPKTILSWLYSQRGKLYSHG